MMLAAATTVALAAPAAASADTWSSQAISYTTTEGRTQTGASVRFLTPGSWARLRPRDTRHLSFHRGDAACRYSITWTTRIAADSAQTPAERVAAALPVPSAAYLLDHGTRGASAAWRVTRTRTTDGRVRLRAMRADRKRLAAGRPVWQETVVTAISRARDECHAGSYRAALGPQIGTALAAATGRIYQITRRS